MLQSIDYSIENCKNAKSLRARPQMSIGSRIQARREALRLTQEELADLVGTTQRQISRYERGENNPPAELIVALAHVLGTSTDYLLGTTDEPVRPVGGAADLDPLERETVELLRGQSEEIRKRIVNAIRALV